MKNIGIIFLVFCHLFNPHRIHAGNTLVRPYTNYNAFPLDNFIENKGQFSSHVNTSDSIYYVYQHGNDRYYFTNSGITCLLSSIKQGNGEKEENEENYKLIRTKVQMQWLGSNASCRIRSEGRSNHWFTYGEKQFNSRGYKKIVYEGIYPNIDLEYLIHPEGGIKYSLILKPGANPADIRFRYKGRDVQTKQSETGIYIYNRIKTLSESQLKVYDETGLGLTCRYKIENGIISFESDQTWDTKKTITIDPWISPLNNVQGILKGHDVDYDNEGNLYVFSGTGLVSKFNIGGQLIWTFAGMINSISWAPSSAYVSNFVIDKPSGKVYIGQGFESSGTRIVRLDSSGNYDNFVTAKKSNFQEVWDMNYNCANGTIFGMGGSTSSNMNLGAFDVNGNFTSVNITGYGGTNQDIISASQNAKGQMCVILASRVTKAADNKLILLNSNFTYKVYDVPIGRTSFREWDNKSFYMANRSNGFNGLSINNRYAFVYDGKYIRAFNISNGNFISEDSINGNIIKYQGGIVADECNNVYLGSKSGLIYVLHFTGDSFQRRSLITLPVTQGQGDLYDLKYNPYNNMIYFSGYGIVGRFKATELCMTDTSMPVSLRIDCNLQRAIISVKDTSKNIDYSFIWTDVSTGNTVRYKTRNLTNDTLFNPVGGHEYTVKIIKSSICNLAGAVINFSFCDTIYKDTKFIICNGDTVLVNGKSYSMEGDYKDTVVDRYQNTHYPVITVKIYKSLNSIKTVNICKGDTFRYKGNYYTDSALINDTLINYIGCDSFLQIKIASVTKFQISQDLEICYEDTVYVGPNKHFKEGVFTDTLLSRSGCDSIIVSSIRFKYKMICNCGNPIRVPNVFTPNRDIFNEFYPDSLVNSMHLMVYNRWGVLIYNNSDGKGWDGKVNGKEAPDGSYYYMMWFTDCNGRRKEISGVFRLIY